VSAVKHVRQRVDGFAPYSTAGGYQFHSFLLVSAPRDVVIPRPMLMVSAVVGYAALCVKV